MQAKSLDVMGCNPGVGSRTIFESRNFRPNSSKSHRALIITFFLPFSFLFLFTQPQFQLVSVSFEYPCFKRSFKTPFTVRLVCL